MYHATARRWAAAVSFVAISAAPATAQQVSFSALTSGCFFAATTPGNCSASPLAFANGQLSFTGGTISGTTVAGAANGLLLGTFALSGNGPMDFGAPVDYFFRLTTVFLAPTVIAGGPSANFSADLVGSIGTNANGAVVMAWTGPTSQAFSYTNATEQGVFTYGLAGGLGAVNLHGGNTRDLRGDVTSASSTPIDETVGIAVVSTPEPATAGLMALGLIGIAFVRRRRSA